MPRLSDNSVFTIYKDTASKLYGIKYNHLKMDTTDAEYIRAGKYTSYEAIHTTRKGALVEANSMYFREQGI